MGHKHDREAGALQFAKKSKNGIARAGVQCASRFVGQEKVGTVDDRPCDGNTLLLTSRKLGRHMVHSAAQPHLLERSACPGGRIPQRLAPIE